MQPLQRLKPPRNKTGQRSAEALRHPKSQFFRNLQSGQHYAPAGASCIMQHAR